jgi:hypothetical protein
MREYAAALNCVRKTTSPVTESTTIIDGSAKNFELDRLWKTLEIEVGAIFSNACAGAAETTSARASSKPSGRRRLFNDLVTRRRQ